MICLSDQPSVHPSSHAAVTHLPIPYISSELFHPYVLPAHLKAHPTAIQGLTACIRPTACARRQNRVVSHVVSGRSLHALLCLSQWLCTTLDLCLLLQEAIQGNRFKGSLDSNSGLVARYTFTPDNIQVGRTDANGLKKVRPLQ